MAKAKIYWDKSIQAYRLSADFKPELITFLKKNIPVSERTFDPNTKIWTFTEKYLNGTVKLCELVYGVQNVVVLSKQQVEAAYQQTNSSINVKKLDTTDSLLSEFMRLIPFDAAQSAYRKASLTLHPDHGGNMEKMSRLNAIWEKIQKEVYGV